MALLDERKIEEIVTRVLERLGYRVDGYTDPCQALQAFQANPAAYQAVVTDLSMPTMSGIDPARDVLLANPNLPVVMTSGYVRQKDRDAVAAVGVRELLLKPNTVEELGAVLRHARPRIRRCARLATPARWISWAASPTMAVCPRTACPRTVRPPCPGLG